MRSKRQQMYIADRWLKIADLPLVIFLREMQICWNIGLCSGFSFQHLRINSSIVLPRSDDSGSWGRNGMLSPLRTRFTTSNTPHASQHNAVLDVKQCIGWQWRNFDIFIYASYSVPRVVRQKQGNIKYNIKHLAVRTVRSPIWPMQ